MKQFVRSRTQARDCGYWLFAALLLLSGDNDGLMLQRADAFAISSLAAVSNRQCHPRMSNSIIVTAASAATPDENTSAGLFSDNGETGVAMELSMNNNEVSLMASIENLETKVQDLQQEIDSLKTMALISSEQPSGSSPTRSAIQSKSLFQQQQDNLRRQQGQGGFKYFSPGTRYEEASSSVQHIPPRHEVPNSFSYDHDYYPGEDGAGSPALFQDRHWGDNPMLGETIGKHYSV